MELRHLVAKHRARSSRRTGGFTLTEVTWAMLIVGVSGGALLSGFPGGFFNLKLARENLRATQIMLERTETIRLYSWGQVTTNYIPPTFSEPYDPNAAQGHKGFNYIGSISIQPVNIADSSYSNDMRMVTVRLNWQTGGMNRHREITTYIARNGLQNYIY